MTIQFESAIAIPITQRRDLPTGAGVYVVTDGEQVAYVGRAANIRKRWRSHHITKQVGTDSVIYCFLMTHEATGPFEQRLLHELKPMLNKAHTQTFTIIVEPNPNPRYASVHDALAANVPLLAELIRAGRAIRERKAAEDAQHVHPITSQEADGVSA